MQLDLRPEILGRRCRLDLGLVGDADASIAALLSPLAAKADRSHSDESFSGRKTELVQSFLRTLPCQPHSVLAQ